MLITFSVLTILLVLFPTVDNYLDSSMTRHVLIQIPVLIFCGIALGWKLKVRWTDIDHNGITSLIFFAGTLLFWMIPRSLDEAVTSNLLDQVMHMNMIIAGFVLGQNQHKITFMPRAIFSIYSLAMLFTMGIIYTHFSAIICATYTLEEQKDMGYTLLTILPFLFVTLFVWILFSFKKNS